MFAVEGECCQDETWAHLVKEEMCEFSENHKLIVFVSVIRQQLPMKNKADADLP